MARWRGLRWLVAVAAGVILVGLGVVLAWVDLEKADKLGSVIGAFSGLIGLGLSAYGVILARRQPVASPPEVSTPVPPVPLGPPVTNSVTNSTISGPNIQIGSTGGNVEIHRSSDGSA